MSKIGVGVTTYNRHDHLRLFKKQLSESKFTGVFHTAIDEPRKGVAYRKNECLKHLFDCDYVFLFDDDCFPIKAGWAEWFIDKHKATDQNHFLYLKETTTIKKLATGKGLELYNNCGGCFMFLTRKAINIVGAFNEEFGLYGYEHAEYSRRIYGAGLNSMGEYLCPEGAGEYVYSLDYDNHLDFGIDHKPSMPTGEMVSCIQESSKVWNRKEKIIIHRPL